jgi:hypothetical protein
MTGIDIVYDATAPNVQHLPANASYAGYVTGGPEIAWTEADWQARPDAVRIDQTAVGSPWDATADVDDYENGAVTLDELGPRAKLRMASFKNAVRVGQRTPIVYASASNLTDVANALVRAGVDSGIGLWVAHWNVTEPAAIAKVLAASGPFPIVGFQFTNEGTFDISVFSQAWLTNRASRPVTGAVPVLAGIVTFIQAGATDLKSRAVTSTDNDNSWH